MFVIFFPGKKVLTHLMDTNFCQSDAMPNIGLSRKGATIPKISRTMPMTTSEP